MFRASLCVAVYVLNMLQIMDVLKLVIVVVVVYVFVCMCVYLCVCLLNIGRCRAAPATD